ncbi:hypothetical protein SAMN05216205_4704 [Pseudomonas mohnii]|uniref:Uncharacterized protein n=1 Tax=Pseudomonas mohnii TaxID=395600 RepID=A0ABY0YAZ3_9PSED|nr:hypothetical protein [Pseudomonas mohnii]SED25706.1 hypothetical protein SAMN05216205_4704 [Pseudomonas mohnii]
MNFQFVLDDLSAQHQADLLTIEKAMGEIPRSAYAVFELKACGLRFHRGLEDTLEFLKTRLSAFHLVPLEMLLESTGFDLETLVKLVKRVPVILKARPQ